MEWWEVDGLVWTKDLIKKRLNEINDEPWAKVSDFVDTFEHGQVGQCNERLFGVFENNDEAPDLPPIYELKALRSSSGHLTLKHSSDYEAGGLTPKEIFEKYGRRKKDRVEGSKISGSKADLVKRLEDIPWADLEGARIKSIAGILGLDSTNSRNEIINEIEVIDFNSLGIKEMKLVLPHTSRYVIDDQYNRLSVQFGTNDFSIPVEIHDNFHEWWEPGDEKYSQYFSVVCNDKHGFIFEVYHRDDGFLFANDMTKQWNKLKNVVFCIYDTRGSVGKNNEQFKLKSAYICSNIKSPGALLNDGILQLTFSISSKPTNSYHNRSDKFRIDIPKTEAARLVRIQEVWDNVEQII